MAAVKGAYRTVQSDSFDMIGADEAEAAPATGHGKFIALVVLLVGGAAAIATLFAVIS